MRIPAAASTLSRVTPTAHRMLELLQTPTVGTAGAAATAPEGHQDVAPTHIKATADWIADLVREGYSRSAAFRALADEIQRSTVVVVIGPGRCAHDLVRSCVASVHGSLLGRQIGIRIDPHTTTLRLIATIAHELQHTVEIVREPAVLDAPGVLALYRRVGTGPCRSGLTERCETDEALAMEARVLAELSQKRLR